MLTGFPVFVSPPFLVTCPPSLENVLCTEIVLVNCLVVAFVFVYFLWFWAFTRVTRLEKDLRKQIKTNLVVTIWEKRFSAVKPTNSTKWIRKNARVFLTEKECLEAVKSMESGKSPGTVGLSAEIYKVFWKDVSPYKFP